MHRAFDRRKSLQDLERDDWGDPTYNSHLVKTCHRLRRKPLSEFNTEDLRIMIGQGISLSFLVPLALERLDAEPLAEGDFYPGDLLVSVLRRDESLWSNDADELQRIRQIVRKAKLFLQSVDDSEYGDIRTAIEEAPRLLRD